MGNFDYSGHIVEEFIRLNGQEQYMRYPVYYPIFPDAYQKNQFRKSKGKSILGTKISLELFHDEMFNIWFTKNDYKFDKVQAKFQIVDDIFLKYEEGRTEHYQNKLKPDHKFVCYAADIEFHNIKEVYIIESDIMDPLNLNQYQYELLISVKKPS